MKFSDYLIAQFTDIVTLYKKYLGRTLGATMSLTVVCFVGVVILLTYTTFDELSKGNNVSLANYFFYRSSTINTYCITDLSKTVFVFFVAVFSIGFSRVITDEEDNKEVSFLKCIQNIHLSDLFYLLIILFVCTGIDYGLYSLNSFSFTSLSNYSAARYISSTIFQLKIYIPLIIFSLSVTSLTGVRKTKLTFKRIFFLFISLWIVNEFAYEIYVWTKTHLLNLVLIPVETPERVYLIESFLSIPFIALYFLGYHSAMTTSLMLTESNSSSEEKELADIKEGESS